MGQLPQTPSSHPYPLSLQLKLYQAFIYSVPILLTIIIFLLFYLFYLKRRGSSAPHMQPSSLNRATTTTTVLSLPCEMGMKNNNLKEMLPVVIFDEDLRERDTQCCVCLGDFQMKEQLHQIPSCKHMFHWDCIHHWLLSNTTCPLCRASIHPTKMEPPITPNMVRQSNPESGDSAQEGPRDHVIVQVVESVNEERSSSIEGPISCPCSTEMGTLQAREAPIIDDHEDSVAVHIHMNAV